MKKFFFSWIIAICSLGVWAQDELYGFRPIGNDLCWQHVYETDLSPNDILSHFEKSGVFESVQKDSMSIRGNSRKLTLNYRAAGKSYMSAPIIFNSPYSYVAEIEIRGNRYRVLLKNIMFYPNVNVQFSRVSTNSNSTMAVSEMFYNFRTGKAKNRKAAELMDKCLLMDFTINDSAKDEW